MSNNKSGKSACGIQVLANQSGNATHHLLQRTLQDATKMRSRSGENLEGTGDGAGIETSKPTDLLKAFLKGEDPVLNQPKYQQFKQDTLIYAPQYELNDNNYGVGQCFIDPQEEKEKSSGLRPSQKLIENVCRESGLDIIAWRRVPVDPDAAKLTEEARTSMPCIMQAMFKRPPNLTNAKAAQLAAKVSRDIKTQLRKKSFNTSVCSFNFGSVIYKGLLRADQLGPFYPDFASEDYKTVYSKTHVRFTSSSFTRWKDAQPGDEGMINGTFPGEDGHYSDREDQLRQKHGKDQPLLESSLSDSHQFFEHLGDLRAEGFSNITGLKALMPPLDTPHSKQASLGLQKTFNSFSQKTKPYFGPTHAAFSGIVSHEDGGRMGVGAVQDSMGLRPSIYGTFEDDTGEKIFYVTSAAGWPQAGNPKKIKSGEVDYKSRQHLPAGKMVCFVYDKDGQGCILDDDACNQLVQKEVETKGWKPNNIIPITSLKTESNFKTQPSLVAQQRAAYWDLDSIRHYFQMVEEGKQAGVSMGCNIPAAVFSRRPQLLSAFFKQKFGEVLFPPFDPIRERSLVETTVYLGERSLDKPTTNIKLDNPILLPGQAEAIANNEDITTTTLSFKMEAKKGGLSAALERLCRAAEQAINKGTTHIVLQCDAQDEKNMRSSEILAVAALTSYLREQGLILKSTIGIDSNLNDPHHAAVLMACGATNIYPALAYQTIYEEYKDDPKAEQRVADGIKRFHKAMLDSLVQTMSKIGCNRTLSYIGLRAGAMDIVGLDLKEPEDSNTPVWSSLARIFKGFDSSYGGLNLVDIEHRSLAHHAQCLRQKDNEQLPDNGIYRAKVGGVPQGFSQKVVEAFHDMRNKRRLEREATHKSANKQRKQLDTVRPWQQNYSEPEKPIVELKKDPWKRLKTSVDLMLHGNEQQQLKNYLPLAPNPEDFAHSQYTTLVTAEEINKAPRLEAGICANIRVDGRYDDRFIDSGGGWVKTAKNGWQQRAAVGGSPEYQQYTRHLRAIREEEPVSLVDRMFFREQAFSTPIPIEQVERISLITPKTKSGHMSRGALVDEPHKDIANAMASLGAGSGDGEGGPGLAEGAGQQWASGRFGTGPKMMNRTKIIQIKVAQSAKPGEGGELPAYKVTIAIAQNRNVIPGVSLVSPPPNHDIYSIEDLQALIYALGNANPEATISIKLVSQTGVGAVAVGAAKALSCLGKRGEIVMSGVVGGTGRAKADSTKNAGGDGALGIKEAHDELLRAGLREVVDLVASGGIKSLEDWAKSIALGADAAEMATTILMAMGCRMARKCGEAATYDLDGNMVTKGGCPVYLTNTGELYVKSGQQEDLEDFILNLTAGVRLLLAKLGMKSLKELRGRSDLLDIILPEKGPGMEGDFDFSHIVGPTSVVDPKQEPLSAEELRERLINEIAVMSADMSKEDLTNKATNFLMTRFKALLTKEINSTYSQPNNVDISRFVDETYNRLVDSWQQEAHLRRVEEKLAAFPKRMFKPRKDLAIVKDLEEKIAKLGPNEVLEGEHLYTFFPTIEDQAFGAALAPLSIRFVRQPKGIPKEKWPPLKPGEVCVAEDFKIKIFLGTDEKPVTVGQTFAPFCYEFVEYVLTGHAQGTVGNSSIGGKHVIRAPAAKKSSADTMAVVNESSQYGSRGKFFAEGVMGQRAFIRNSGVTFVVLGAGDFACEYMPRGSGIFLGKVGHNFGADMKGGEVAMFDAAENLASYDKRYIEIRDITTLDNKEAYQQAMFELLSEFHQDTGSLKAEYILKNWQQTKDQFSLATPKYFLNLERDLDSKDDLTRRTAIKQIKDIRKSYEPKEKNGKSPITVFMAIRLAHLENKITKKLKSNYDALLKGLSSPEGTNTKTSSISKVASSLVRKSSPGKRAKITLVSGEKTPPSQNIANKSIFFAKTKSSNCTCHQTQCSGGCALNKNVSSYIPDFERFMQRMKKAGKDPFTTKLSGKDLKEFTKIFMAQAAASPFFHFTGLVCDAKCQPACTQDPDVEIRDVELLIARIGRKNKLFTHLFKKPKVSNGKTVAIVGSGIAGLKAAYELRRRGYQVIVFEKDDQLGGLLRYGIPDEKLPKKDVLDFYINQLRSMGIVFKTGVNVNVDKIEQTIQGEKYAAVIQATGVTAYPRIPRLTINKADGTILAETLEDAIAKGLVSGVYPAMDYLYERERIRSGSASAEDNKFADMKGKPAMTLGGGQTANDVLHKLNKQLKKDGACVTATDRHPKQGAKASFPYPAERQTRDVNYKKKATDGLQARDLYQVQPEEILLDKEGCITHVLLRHLKLPYPESNEFPKRHPLRQGITNTEYKVDPHNKLESGTHPHSNKLCESGTSWVKVECLFIAAGYNPPKQQQIFHGSTKTAWTYVAGDKDPNTQDWVVVAAERSATNVAEAVDFHLKLAEMMRSVLVTSYNKIPGLTLLDRDTQKDKLNQLWQEVYKPNTFNQKQNGQIQQCWRSLLIISLNRDANAPETYTATTTLRPTFEDIIWQAARKIEPPQTWGRDQSAQYQDLNRESQALLSW